MLYRLLRHRIDWRNLVTKFARPAMSSEELSLPPASDPSTPLDLTPSPTPHSSGRDPVIQRSAVFGTRYLTDPSKVFEHNAWDQVTPDPEHLAAALEKIKFQHEHKLPDKKRLKFLDRPAYFWDMFYLNNGENFFKNRKWLVREFPTLKTCMLKEVYSSCMLLTPGG